MYFSSAVESFWPTTSSFVPPQVLFPHYLHIMPNLKSTILYYPSQTTLSLAFSIESAKEMGMMYMILQKAVSSKALKDFQKELLLKTTRVWRLESKV